VSLISETARAPSGALFFGGPRAPPVRRWDRSTGPISGRASPKNRAVT